MGHATRRASGTIEIRRFHGTLNANTLCCWSAFCVSFVERFLSSMDAVKAVFDAPLAQGLAALKEAQEGATLQQLEAEMSSHLHPGVTSAIASIFCVMLIPHSYIE
jgi:hypothetical protein